MLRFIAIVGFVLLSSSDGITQSPRVNVKEHDIVVKHDPVRRKSDSLKMLLRTTMLDADKVTIYGQLISNYVGALGEVKVGRQYADSIRRLADDLNDEKISATSDYYYGLVERYEGKYVRSLNHFQRHLNYCNAVGDTIETPGTLFQMAVVQQMLGNYENSLNIGYKAIAAYEKNRDSYGLAITFMHVGILFGRLKSTEEAIVMYHKALTIFDTLGSELKVKMNKARVLINLGTAYKSIKDYSRAKKLFSQSLALSHAVGANRITTTALSNIGDIFKESQQYDSALRYNLEALRLREEAFQIDKIPTSWLTVGETYMYLGKHDKANDFFLRALSLSKQFQSRPATRDAYEQLSKLNALQLSFQKAFEYNQLFMAMKDSVLNEETARQLNELKTKYESQEKDKQIVILKKTKEIQVKEMQRQATLNKAYVSGLLSVLIVAALVIYIVRQHLRLTAKSNLVKEADYKRQLTELEMKALRAQINPHFLFNCMNAIDLMIIKGQSEKASAYLAKFSKLVRLILENTEAAAVTLESEMALLEAYIQLEELRLPGRIAYRISVDKSIGTESTYLPSMVLQPVVENAIWHGIVHKENGGKGNILIDVQQRDKELLCTIEDNGVGRDKSQQLRNNSIMHHKSLGMKITEERLRLRNGKHARQCIHITDLKDTLNHPIGTRVTMHIPIAE
ncbi:MAG: tetratricopeptide repeat protein [Chryseolinea sp.]